MSVLQLLAQGAESVEPSTITDVLIPIVVAVMSSGVLVALVQLYVGRPDRQVDREGKVVETASNALEFLERQLDQERKRHEKVVIDLSERVAALETRLDAAEERAERYAALLWEARAALSERDKELDRARRDLDALGDGRRPRSD